MGDENEHEHVAAPERSADLVGSLVAAGVGDDVGHVGKRVGRHDVGTGGCFAASSDAAAKMSYGYFVTLTAPRS